MRDGKALQLATSHELGQNFARAFDITYASESGTVEHCWTTSWGSSTRMVGGVIMCHGDDAGLRLPPAVAPAQVVLVAVKDDPDVLAVVARLERELDELGVRLRVDQRTDLGLGRRLTDWELKGVPVRLELGPRDLAAQTVSLVRRDGGERAAVALDAAAAAARDALAAAQDELLTQARFELERRTTEVATLEEAIEAAGDGFARIDWATCGLDGERRANAAGVTVRCLMRADGSAPDSVDEGDLVAVLARAY